MRVSVKQHFWLAPDCQAFLDGVEVSADCIEADEEAGYVVVYSKDAAGKKFSSPTNPNEIARERKEGEVRIVLSLDGQHEVIVTWPEDDGDEAAKRWELVMALRKAADFVDVGGSINIVHSVKEVPCDCAEPCGFVHQAHEGSAKAVIHV